MDGSTPDDVDPLFARLHRTRKYRSLEPILLAELIEQERSGDDVPAAVDRRVRLRLHRAFGAFTDGVPSFARWVRLLDAAGSDDAELRTACARILRSHASTRERWPELSAFYGFLTEGEAEPESIVDFGCGLQPLSLPWSPLSKATPYRAVDAVDELTTFLRQATQRLGYAVTVECADVRRVAGSAREQLGLALKLLPSLDALEPGAAERFVRELRVDSLLTSVSEHSLGGRASPAANGWATRMRAWARDGGWTISEHRLANERLSRWRRRR